MGVGYQREHGERFLNVDMGDSSVQIGLCPFAFLANDIVVLAVRESSNVQGVLRMVSHEIVELGAVSMAYGRGHRFGFDRSGAHLLPYIRLMTVVWIGLLLLVTVLVPY